MFLGASDISPDGGMGRVGDGVTVLAGGKSYV